LIEYLSPELGDAENSAIFCRKKTFFNRNTLGNRNQRCQKCRICHQYFYFIRRATPKSISGSPLPNFVAKEERRKSADKIMKQVYGSTTMLMGVNHRENSRLPP